MPSPKTREREPYWAELSRAFGGAIFFSLPILMTMEMWWLGFHMDRDRLAAFMLLALPVLVGLARQAGARRASTWGAAAREGVIAYAIGFIVSALLLYLFGVIRGVAFDEVMGKLGVQSVPAAFGAIVGAGQFGGGEEAGGGKKEGRQAGYGIHLFYMLAGALYLGITVAPTEEMILIAFKMGYDHAFALGLASLAAMHALLHAVHFRRRHHIPAHVPWASVFLRFTTVGYAIALAVSGFVLWTFGRFEGIGSPWAVVDSIVLGFPASLGAAAARLLL